MEVRAAEIMVERPPAMFLLTEVRTSERSLAKVPGVKEP